MMRVRPSGNVRVAVMMRAHMVRGPRAAGVGGAQPRAERL
jgi:hypothetical protein